MPRRARSRYQRRARITSMGDSARTCDSSRPPSGPTTVVSFASVAETGTRPVYLEIAGSARFPDAPGSRRGIHRATLPALPLRKRAAHLVMAGRRVAREIFGGRRRIRVLYT